MYDRALKTETWPKKKGVQHAGIEVVLIIKHSFYFFTLDPNHDRAGTNLRYFEKMLEKEKSEEKVNETLDTEPQNSRSDVYTRPQDYLPERETYEALCRGEGVRMVTETVACKYYCLMFLVYALSYGYIKQML